MRESDIVWQGESYWVAREARRYNVLKSGVTHSMSICQFALDADGLSCAVAYAKYLEKRSR